MPPLQANPTLLGFDGEGPEESVFLTSSQPMLLAQGPCSEERGCRQTTGETRVSDFIGERNMNEITGEVDHLTP